MPYKAKNPRGPSLFTRPPEVPLEEMEAIQPPVMKLHPNPGKKQGKKPVDPTKPPRHTSNPTAVRGIRPCVVEPVPRGFRPVLVLYYPPGSVKIYETGPSGFSTCHVQTTIEVAKHTLAKVTDMMFKTPNHPVSLALPNLKDIHGNYVWDLKLYYIPEEDGLIPLEEKQPLPSSQPME